MSGHNSNSEISRKSLNQQKPSLKKPMDIANPNTLISDIETSNHASGYNADQEDNGSFGSQYITEDSGDKKNLGLRKNKDLNGNPESERNKNCKIQRSDSKISNSVGNEDPSTLYNIHNPNQNLFGNQADKKLTNSSAKSSKQSSSSKGDKVTENKKNNNSLLISNNSKIDSEKIRYSDNINNQKTLSSLTKSHGQSNIKDSINKLKKNESFKTKISGSKIKTSSSSSTEKNKVNNLTEDMDNVRSVDKVPTSRNSNDNRNTLSYKNKLVSHGSSPIEQRNDKNNGNKESSLIESDIDSKGIKPIKNCINDSKNNRSTNLDISKDNKLEETNDQEIDNSRTESTIAQKNMLRNIKEKSNKSTFKPNSNKDNQFLNTHNKNFFSQKNNIQGNPNPQENKKSRKINKTRNKTTDDIDNVTYDKKKRSANSSGNRSNRVEYRFEGMDEELEPTTFKHNESHFIRKENKIKDSGNSKADVSLLGQIENSIELQDQNKDHESFESIETSSLENSQENSASNKGSKKDNRDIKNNFRVRNEERKIYESQKYSEKKEGKENLSQIENPTRDKKNQKKNLSTKEKTLHPTNRKSRIKEYIPYFIFLVVVIIALGVILG